MAEQSRRVHGADGWRGVIRGEARGGMVEVQVEGGPAVMVPEGLMHREADGSYRVQLGMRELAGRQVGAVGRDQGDVGAGHSVTVPVVQERALVEKRVEETGRTVVRVVPSVRTEAVDVELSDEEAEVERRPRNELVERAEGVHQEGDVTVIPVYEEVLVVERRLMLREEVRVRRRRVVRKGHEEVELRTEAVRVERKGQ